MLCQLGAVLLCHRRADRAWFPNVWDLPGGHVRAGESASAALVRELREELAIKIAVPTTEPFAIIEDLELEIHLKVWFIEWWEGPPMNAAPEEHDRLGWFHRDELSPLPLADDRYRTLLHDALSRPPTS